MTSKIVIAFAAAATLFAASAIEASARPGGGGGGGGMRGGSFGGGGGMRSVGGMGMRSSGFVGANRGFVGVNRGFVGVNRGFVGAGVVRGSNIARYSGVNHRPYWRNRYLVGGGFGYGLGYSSCMRQVWGDYGLTWVNVCAYPDYYNSYY